jgi:uncharacterized Ntn-hydrolase superfamily protein
MTMSIAARCPLTGMFGVAVASSSIAVASRCAHVRAGVGAVLSQNVTDPSLGPLVLDLMERGKSHGQILESLLTSNPHLAWRQLVMVSVKGAPAIFSGERALGIVGESIGPDCAAAGNLLANPSVPEKMTRAFEECEGHLAARLIHALRAGLEAGGEAGPLHAAGVKVAGQVPWPVVDLRVDWSDAPIEQLGELWRLYQPQLGAYVLRALSPDAAPAYGVAGDP